QGGGGLGRASERARARRVGDPAGAPARGGEAAPAERGVPHGAAGPAELPARADQSVAAGPHSMRMLASRTTRAQVAISSATKAAKASRGSPPGAEPEAMMRSRRSELASAPASAACSRATIGSGVRAGRKAPTQV